MNSKNLTKPGLARMGKNWSVRWTSLSVRDKYVSAGISISNGPAAQKREIYTIGLQLESYSILTYETLLTAVEDLKLILDCWLSELLRKDVYRVQATVDGAKYLAEFRALVPAGNGYQKSLLPTSHVAQVELTKIVDVQLSGLTPQQSDSKSVAKDLSDTLGRVRLVRENSEASSPQISPGEALLVASQVLRPMVQDETDSNSPTTEALSEGQSPTDPDTNS